MNWMPMSIFLTEGARKLFWVLASPPHTKDTSFVARMNDRILAAPEEYIITNSNSVPQDLFLFSDKIRANIAFSIALKSAFLVMAVMGLATLWMAVVADMGASLIVIANALRLLRE
jgi:hypothetical protein